MVIYLLSKWNEEYGPDKSVPLARTWQLGPTYENMITGIQPSKEMAQKIHDQKENQGPRKEINKAELLGQSQVANKSTGKKYINKAELLG